MINLIKKIPWYFWVLFFISLFLFFKAGEIKNIALEYLKSDIVKILEEKEKYIEDCEREISLLANQIQSIRTEKERILIELKEKDKKILELKQENENLNEKIKSIIIPDDPDKLIDGLKKRFPSIRRIGN